MKGAGIQRTGAWCRVAPAENAAGANPVGYVTRIYASGRQVGRGWSKGAAVSPVKRSQRAENATAAPALQAWRLMQSKVRSHGRGAGSARGAHDQLAMMEFAKQHEQPLTLPELINFGRNADR